MKKNKYNSIQILYCKIILNINPTVDLTTDNNHLINKFNLIQWHTKSISMNTNSVADGTDQSKM